MAKGKLEIENYFIIFKMSTFHPLFECDFDMFQYRSKNFSHLGVWLWYLDEIEILVWNLNKFQTIQIRIDIHAKYVIILS